MGNRSKNIPTLVQVTKAFLKDWESGLFVKLGNFSCSWIRIRIPNTDPDPGKPNQCCSMRIRIHNTTRVNVRFRTFTAQIQIQMRKQAALIKYEQKRTGIPAMKIITGWHYSHGSGQ
jgi:hypothetical protein